MEEQRGKRQLDEFSSERTPFEVDRDRVLYSYEFRRLAGITQAANASEGPNLHNRLTHSLKVAQVGRRLAQYLLKRFPGEISQCGDLNPDVVECACLAHDLGHPPFGHVAERVLHSCLQDVDPRLGFEGNAQSFRIVVKTSIRRLESRGLNLTSAALNAILKYPWGQTHDKFKDKAKWGYYPEESEAFNFARSGLPSDRLNCQTLEAAAMDLADDIAYSVHDVDDFYRAGLIPLDQLINGAEERKSFLEWICDSEAAKLGVSRKFIKKAGSRFFGTMRIMAESLHEPFVYKRKQLQDLHALTSSHITRFLGCGGGPSPFHIDPSADTQIVRADWLSFEIRILKLLMKRYVYQDNCLLAQQHGHRRLIKEVFSSLMESARDYGSEGMVPRRFELEADEAKGNPSLAARLAADVICSMDEPQILTLYQRLIGIRPGILAERLIN